MATITSPKKCPACGGELLVERLKCGRCTAAVEGSFLLPRLARLTKEDQRFLELFAVSGGSLKAVSKMLEVSYPTVRKRLDELISNLEAEIARDEQSQAQLIKEIGEGKVSASEGAERLRKSK